MVDRVVQKEDDNHLGDDSFMKPYFHRFENRAPPSFAPMSQRRTMMWQILAGFTTGVSLWYLWWRWTSSLNPDALTFSVVVALAETLFFVGTVLFFHDVWEEKDTPRHAAPGCRSAFGGDYDPGPTTIDVFITTFDEEVDVVRPTLVAAQGLEAPANTQIAVWLLDDGNRSDFARLANEFGIGYLQRDNNRGFKAGNLKNALLQTSGDFIVICDADTRVFPKLLLNTLGYFQDSKVAWVQTPHWFYDIPEGLDLRLWINQKIPRSLWFLQRPASYLAQIITGKDRVGTDPMLSESALFFDVIQRRRNRNSASFCCGAGSIHRRESLFQSAIFRYGKALNSDAIMRSRSLDFEPFKFHVSEDIYTSIQLHSDPENHWKSVYHPDVECRMLSPWTMDAWATQKLKYAGGTFDIMLKDNPVFQTGMPWRTKLHYMATFWSYLSALWVPIMMFAPILSIFTGWAPVEAYSIEFFVHILPVLLVSEAAMVLGCKGHNIHIGRVMAVGGLPIVLRAFWLVLLGQRPKFPATPKTPVFTDKRFERVLPNIAILTIMAAGIGYGVWAYSEHLDGYSASFLIVNIFWIFWNALGHIRVIAVAAWRPPAYLKSDPLSETASMKESFNHAPV
jgi:cellulose synthase (UDP-forming)